MKKRCFNKFLMAWGMAIGLLIPSSVSAQVNWNEKDVNGNEWGHLTSETEIFCSSSSRANNITKDQIIALWNVGAKRYLYQGGHWGTETVLSDNIVPLYFRKQDDGLIQMPNNIPDGNTAWALAMNLAPGGDNGYSTTAGPRYRVGWVQNSNSDSQGLFIDNGSTGGYIANTRFNFVLLDAAKKIYAITSGSTVITKATSLTSGNQYYLSDGTNYLTHTNATVATTTSVPTFMWTITQEADGTYTIKDGSYYLTTKVDGDYECTTTPTAGYKWNYNDGYFSTVINIPVGTMEAATPGTETAQYYISNGNTASCLSYTGSGTVAANADANAAVKWTFEHVNNQTNYSNYRIYCTIGGTNYYLYVNSGALAITTNRPSYYWRLYNNGSLYYYGGTNNTRRYLTGGTGTTATWGVSNTASTNLIYNFVPTGTNESTRYLRVSTSSAQATTSATSEPLYTQGAMYLDQNGGTEGNGRYYVITRKTYDDINSIPETAKWKILNRMDFETAFEHTEATNATPADATFFIGNPGLSRKGGDNWTLSNGSTSGNVTRIGNSLNYNTTGTQPGNENGGTLEDTGATLNSQNGNGYTITAEDVALGFTTNAQGTTGQYYQAVYGGTFNGRISGTSGAATQNVTVTRKGYYIVGVYAYIDGPGTAVLRAEANGGVNHGTDGGRHLGIANIHEAGTEAQNLSMTKAGILFLNEEEATSKYFVTTMVYVDKANPASSTSTALEQLRITVNLTGGSADTKVAFDNFRLYYVGDADPILLDEVEGALDYVQPQVFDEVRDKARTLYLKRAVNNGVWNSITLPVNLTAQQVKQAFGNDTRLCRYEKVDDNLKNIIWFKELDLSNNNTVAIESGKNYIMLPTNATPATTGSYTTNFTSQEVRGEEIAEWTITATLASPVFTINQVSMPQAPTQDPDPNADIHTTTDRYIMNFRGSYVAGNFVTPNSYIIAGNSKADSYTAGNWYHWVGTSNLAVKGFRCWIGSTTTENETWIDPIPSEGDNITEGTLGGTTAGEDENPAKLIFMIMDNDGETTAINAIQVGKDTYEAVATPAVYNDNVYSVNGQLVGKGIDALNNLAKGIYIMNGKKYVVK